MNGESRLLLIIEDDLQYARFLTELLSIEGYRVVHAANGKEGVRLCDSEKPEALLLDLVMPEMDGIEAIQILNARHPEIPILAMSGGNFGHADVYLSLSTHLGAQEILKKPFDADTLLTRLDKMLLGGNRFEPQT